MPTQKELIAQFDTTLNTIHPGIKDRIGQGILHREYNAEYALPDLRHFTAQREPVLEAYRAFSRYDTDKKLPQSAKVIFLPPSSLVNMHDAASVDFLKRFSGLPIDVIVPNDPRSNEPAILPANLVQGLSDEWELAVTQGDWSESLKHEHFDLEHPEALPSYLHKMSHLSPLGYVALGGSVDHESRHCTYLLTEDGTTAYGSYRQARPQPHPLGRYQADSGQKDESAKARIVISTERPSTRRPRHKPEDLPARRRLAFHYGQAA